MSNRNYFINLEISKKDVENLFERLSKMDDIEKKESNSSVWKKAHKRRVSQETGKCDRCPWHKRENAGLSRDPRTDKYKTLKKRKSRAQKTKERKNVYGHLPID